MNIFKKIVSIIVFLTMPYQAMGEERAQHVLHDLVLTKDTIWSGTVTIKGVVVVRRGVTLTILPGTTVRFQRVDTNGDGIGDSELRILGQILARGSAAKPIIFQSAEKNPQPMDWSYLLIFTSGQENTLQYCRFRDAFSGLQVHFSTAAVSDCWFSDNLEGIRFGRTKLTVSNSTFSNNQIGIRFTRMEGPVEITNTIISKNSVGIFLVPSGQNIVDFFEPDNWAGKPWNEGHLKITSNNIYNNNDYDLKFGAKQMWDLEISGNWWGETEIDRILATIFDKNRDSELGRAIIQPLAPAPIAEAGPRQANRQ